MATISGTAGNDTLVGTSSNDTILGSTGNDVIDGGAGFDSIEYKNAANGLIVDFAAGTISGGAAGNMTFSNIERIVAGNFNDQMTGNSASQTLTGQGGNDTLAGAGGADTLWGGAGNDTFVFRETGTANADRISDWQAGVDTILLDGAVMTALGASGDFSAGDARFWSSGTGTAHDADDRVIYNTSNGQLWYDADGNGSGAAVLIATVLNAPSLVATDIAVENGSTGGGGGGNTGSAGNDSITGTAGNDSINGLAGNDTINGLAGMDTIDGGSGVDSMIGGDDDDIFIVDNVGDVVVELEGGGSFDEVRSSVTYTLPSWVNNLTLTGTAAINGTGNELDNVIVGNSAGNQLAGGGGLDTLDGGTGNDTYRVEGEFDDVILDAGGSDTLLVSNLPAVIVHTPASIENLTVLGDSRSPTEVRGNALNNVITNASGEGIVLDGGDGNDTLIGVDGLADVFAFAFTSGNYGSDFVDGGAGGQDLLNFSYNQGDLTAVIVDFRAGTATSGTVGSVSFVGIEAVIGTEMTDSLVANDAGIEMRGAQGSDTLIGGAGADHLFGAGWSEESPGADDSLVGGAGNDTLEGAFGDDVLNGGAGNDFLLSERPDSTDDGNDRYVFDVAPGSANADFIDRSFRSGSDKIVLDRSAHANLGTLGNFAAGDARFWASANGAAHDADDRVLYNTSTGQIWYDADGNGSGSAQLIATLEANPSRNLAATDIVAIDGTGGASGGAVINGTSGNDTLVGGPGNDTISGLGGNDSLIGNAGNDRLLGGTGNDTLNSGEGNNTLDGGTGDDTYLVPSGINPNFPGNTIFDADGVDTLIITTDSFGGTNFIPFGIENLTLRGDTFLGEAYGNELNNVMRNEGNHWVVLGGGDGNDTLIGMDGQGDVFTFGFGSGNWGSDFVDGGASLGDWFNFDYNGTDVSAVVVDFRTGTVTGGGIDGSGSISFVNVRNARATSFDDRLIARDTGNEMQGADGNDTLIGGAGADHLSGDGFWDGSGFTGGNDSVVGGAGNDVVVGGFGNDTLNGGAGNDTLRGFDDQGSFDGNDQYIFDVAPGAANADFIDRDFESGADKIVLDGNAHANLGASGNFAAGDARFWSSSAGTAHDADDRVVYNTSTGQLWYDADGNGTGAAQLIASFDTLGGVETLIATDIVAVNGTGAGGSTINGTSSNDSLLGTSGNDTINGFAGLDTIDGGTGADSMIGGDDHDVYFVDDPGDVIVEFENGGIDEVRSTINFTLPDWVNNLTLVGSFAFDGVGNAVDNVITGNALSNNLTGGAGVDVLIGGDGQDRLDGRFGVSADDHESFAETLDGGLGNDFYLIDNAGDSLFDSGGADTVQAYGIDWTLGAGFEDLLLATGGKTGIGNGLANGMQAVHGGRLEGFAGNDTLIGGSNDPVSGADGKDWLDGGSGNDYLAANSGLDTFAFTVAPGAANADQISEFVSADDQILLDGFQHANSGVSGTFSAGDARFWSSSTGTAHDVDDRVIYNTATGELWYDADGTGAGARQLIATLLFAPVLTAADIDIVNGSGGGGGGGGSSINGTAGNDTLSGTAGNDTINALGGNDTVLGSFGSDVIDGGVGTDSIEYKNAPNGLIVDFAAGTVSGGAAGSMTFTGIERFVAGGFNDQMNGNGASQILTGQNGNDTLAGAGGTDTLWGGGGSDFFVFREMGTANADRISDWGSGTDKVQLDDSAFTAIGAAGNFAAGDARFWSSTAGTAHDANDRVIYDTDGGQLYYDADGSGSGAAQLIANVLNAPAIAATDIVVV